MDHEFRIAVFMIAGILCLLGYIGYSQGAFENVDIPFIGDTELTPEEKRNNFDFCVLDFIADRKSSDAATNRVTEKMALEVCRNELK